ncbi:MAG: hypothetical protein J6B60_03245 [Clostridia bacterium]|nr:hypothetical protein [Clostridia bacterium]MBO5416053.1 hypothetical protein [Clostridia bacterium]
MNDISKELCEERAQRTEKRLDKHSSAIDELCACSVKLTEMMRIHNERIDDHESRLGSLEKRPGDIVGRVIDALISAVTAAIVCMIL